MPSMISLKPLNPILKNINPKELGVVCPNGQINFSNSETAEKYAKNLILKSLNRNKERLVITKDTRVLMVADGKNDRVNINIDNSLFPTESDCNIYHGHPDTNTSMGYATTFSNNDTIIFIMLNKMFGYKKSIVYNSKGEECSMTMKSDKRSFLSKTRLSKYMKHFLYNLNPISQLKELYLSLSSKPFYNKTDFDNFFNTLKSRCSQDELDYMYTKLSNKKDFCNWVENKFIILKQHDCVKKQAKMLGIDYKTTFSYLKD